LLLKVFGNKEASVVKNAVFPGCFSLSALMYSSLAEVQKFITLRPLAVSGSVNNRWKAEELLYVGMFVILPDSGCKGTKTGKFC
jgi:hypothetical protein